MEGELDLEYTWELDEPQALTATGLWADIVADLYAAADDLDALSRALGCQPAGETSRLIGKLRTHARTLERADAIDQRVAIKLAEENAAWQTRYSWAEAEVERLQLDRARMAQTIAHLRDQLERWSVRPMA